jgi:hypothetical protein
MAAKPSHQIIRRAAPLARFVEDSVDPVEAHVQGCLLDETQEDNLRPLPLE